jgi:hypothetical protein
MSHAEPAYAIGDAYAMHIAYPDTFALPDPQDIRGLHVGDFAKLDFILGTVPEQHVERMWVRIADVGDGCTFTGILDNEPLVMGALHAGEEIKFSAAHITGIQRAE